MNQKGGQGAQASTWHKEVVFLDFSSFSCVFLVPCGPGHMFKPFFLCEKASFHEAPEVDFGNRIGFLKEIW